MAANTDDFLGEGTAESAFAPFRTPEQIAEDERARIEMENRRAAAATSTNNIGYRQRMQAEDAWKRANPEHSYYQSEAERRHMLKNRHSLGGALVRDPLTLGILLAPAAVTGAGAAIGGGAALGFGEAAAAGGAATTPAITTGGATVAPTLAAPTAVGATAAPAAGTTAAVSSGLSAGQVIGGLQAATSAGMLLNDVFGSNGDEEKLKRKQAQLAEEARKRQGLQHQQQMNALGQQMLAFNPQNQLMAQMFGPQAAFSPEQMAQMAKDPAAVDPSLVNYQGTDPAVQAKVMEQIQRLEQDKQRQQMLTQSLSPLPQGPAALKPTQVQQQRKF